MGVTSPLVGVTSPLVGVTSPLVGVTLPLVGVTSPLVDAIATQDQDQKVNEGSYSDSFDKNDKRALRKRANFFAMKNTNLYYTQVVSF